MISHLMLHFSSLDQFCMSKHSCVPCWAKTRNVKANQRERLIWKMSSARSFTYICRISRLLWRLFGPETSASLGLLSWLVGKQMQRNSSVRLILLGSTWD